MIHGFKEVSREFACHRSYVPARFKCQRAYVPQTCQRTIIRRANFSTWRANMLKNVPIFSNITLTKCKGKCPYFIIV